MKIWFDLVNADGSVMPMGCCFRHACLFGWAGRNKEEVMAHAAELAEHGIRGPKGMPEHFIMSPNVITHDDDITVIGDKTCGEIEFFFFRKEGRIYVGVGSEHTDRGLESVDIVKSKAICQKPMSRQLWRYEDVREHWDDIRLTSWQRVEGGEKIRYQDAPLAALLPLEDLLGEAKKLYDSLEDVIVWSGTVTALDGLVYGSHFSGEMADPVLNRKLSFAYDVRVAPADDAC